MVDISQPWVPLTNFNERFKQALNALHQGRPIILMDDFDRENEADLIVAAEKINEPTMAMLIRECSGIVCLCLTEDTVSQLKLPPMTSNNQSRYGTAFTVSIEAKYGITTGVSAADRVTTIQAAISDNASEKIVSPGHVFPIQAKFGGVLTRRGHTEGSIDLCILAGLKPAAVLCELMNPNGTMARGQAVLDFSTKHNMPILTIEELVNYRKL